jgi:hypothetical protein
MPPVNILNTAEVAIRGLVGTQEVENVLCYHKITGTQAAADIDALAVWWGNTGWPQYRLVLPTAFVLQDIVVKSLDQNLHYERVISPTGTQTGNIAGEIVQGETAPINWKSTDARRRARGRTSIGPVPEASVTGEAVLSTLTTLLANLAAYLIVQHPNGTYQFSIGSRKFGEEFPIIAAVVKALVGTMRTRLTRK